MIDAPALRAQLRDLAIVGLLALALALGFAAGAAASTGCNTAKCEQRVQTRQAHAKWRPVVAAYGLGRLVARMRCEAGGNGGYALDTTGNGYWFAHQFNPAAWAGAGGRIRDGRPVGVWTRHPSRLEQNYRAAVWDRRHRGDAWPNCP